MLDGITVLSAESHITAPKSTQILRDLGAEVIKVEHPDGGDRYRQVRRPEGYDGPNDLSYAFLMFNRGKKSIALDFSTEEGREIFHALARDADVLVENRGPGTMDGFGLGYEDIKAVNESIVYCSISGFGQTGRYKDHRALDPVVQGASGLVHFNGTACGTPHLTPMLVADEVTGLVAANSVLAALVPKLLGGEGTYLDVSMLDNLVSLFDVEMADYAMHPDGDVTNTYDRELPSGVYDTATDPILVFVSPGEDWERFCRSLGLDEWIDSGAYVDERDVVDDREAVDRRIREVLETESREVWLERLRDEGDLYVGPVFSVQEVFDHEVTRRERGVVSEAVDDDLGPFTYLRYPVSAPDRDLDVPESVPRLGEHSTEILEELGYGSDEIVELLDRGVAHRVE